MSNYQIFNEDNRVGLAELPDNYADLVVLDPPYFDYVTGHRKEKSKLTESLHQQTREEMIDVVWESLRILKSHRAFFIFTNWEQDWWMQQVFQTHLKNKVIWVKDNWTAGDLKGSLANQYEVILLGTKDTWEYNGKRISDIWNFPRVDSDKRLHSTEKPVDLLCHILSISTQEGDTVIDPYMGSGSTGEACLKMNRQFLGWEIDQHYFEIAKFRLEHYR